MSDPPAPAQRRLKPRISPTELGRRIEVMKTWLGEMQDDQKTTTFAHLVVKDPAIYGKETFFMMDKCPMDTFSTVSPNLNKPNKAQGPLIARFRTLHAL